jgi:hypothetical protein
MFSRMTPTVSSICCWRTVVCWNSSMMGWLW